MGQESKSRVHRLNSLLKEVISDVIHKQVRNPNICQFTSVTRVDITKDLRYAKVYISIIGDDKLMVETLNALESAAGFIAITSSKQVVMHHFPALTFMEDLTVKKHLRIDAVLKEINEKDSTTTTHLKE